MSSAVRSGWSVLGAMSRFRAPPRGMLFGSHGTPRPAEIRLPPAQEHTIRERLKPVIARLEQQRQAWFDTVEQQLRLAMGGAAAAGLVLGWLFMGSFLLGLALMAGGAFFAFLMRAPQADEVSRARTKHAIIEAMAGDILGLTPVAPDRRAATLPKTLVDTWHLLPRIRVVTLDDRFEGEKAGCRIALSRVGFHLGGNANVQFKQGDGLVFVLVEITGPDAPEPMSDAGFAVVLGSDAPPILQNAPRQSHGLAEARTGDADFDARYRVFGDAAPLTADVRAGFVALEAVARCDRTGTREVPAGTGLRPALVIRPGRLVVLTPVAVFDGALEPPPFWQSLNPDTLIPAFAADLAILNDHLTAAMTLRSGLS